jgi:hypothetical protein
MNCSLKTLSVQARRLAVAAALLSAVTQVLLIGSLFDALRGGIVA